MFGRRFFGGAYYGPRYFGAGGGDAPEPDPVTIRNAQLLTSMGQMMGQL